MIKLDEAALICDLAETYQIYNYKQLPVSTVAVFACGLKPDSRIKMKLNDRPIPIETQLLVGLYDVVNLIAWSKTKDAQKGVKRPASVMNAIMGTPTSQPHTAVTFDSGKDFERIRNKLITGGE